jgi:hypothetical protein
MTLEDTKPGKYWILRAMVEDISCNRLCCNHKTENVQACLDVFGQVGITAAAAVGEINDTYKVEIHD